jgi:WD40 repeat protein
MTAYAFDAFVADARFDGAGRPWFALGDGRVASPGLPERQAHAGAVLCAVAHPSGQGLLTGGDDGLVAWTRAEGSQPVFERPGRWIDALDASSGTGLVAFAAGRELHVRDLADSKFERLFRHERSVAAVAFDPKGRRLAAATYGGAALWYARIADQKPQTLKWAGSHIAALWSPDGKYLITSMQENALHGWRLSDGKDMRMGGYPAKVRSLAFLSRGRLMASAGAPSVVLWPFAGADGPMGKEAVQIAYVEGSEVTRVAATPAADRIAGGRADGSVFVAEAAGQGLRQVKEAKGVAISALALSADGNRLAWGDETGRAAVLDL